MQRQSVAAHLGAIMNAGWWVRHYCRPHQRELRAQAILALGLACRAAFNSTEEFEPVINALVDAVTPPRERF